ncbi:uracil-DNA glycosylase [Yunchengibacter salinarum]|uniref:uracil-DNA glycosylase n=1 Tax=Yunchengibacter salinarum TaxID=3133399 RepID=UPI0035B695DC
MARAAQHSGLPSVDADTPPDPPADCPLCPRLVAFRRDNQARHPDFFNGAVGSFGDPKGRLLIVGLAPGLKGANCTGRPFTGDYAGDLLYDCLKAAGLASGAYARRPDDGLALADTMVTNAVRCVPPQNKPVGDEINTCRPFLLARMRDMPHLTTLLALGRIAHETLIRALGLRQKDYPFGHNARHDLGAVTLVDSYHCSRYNVNTGRITRDMFMDALATCQTAMTERAAP